MLSVVMLNVIMQCYYAECRGAVKRCSRMEQHAFKISIVFRAFKVLQ
jgi:hypothetical protein